MSVKKARRILPRCSGVTSDGTQCGRRVADGSNPPLCHIHAAIARGQQVSPLTDHGDDFDEVKALKRLARSSNEQVRLRAIDLLLELKRKQREQATKDVSTPNARTFLNALTPAERELVATLVGQLREVQKVVYEREPQLRPATWAPDCVVDPADVVSAAEPVEDVAAATVEDAPTQDPDDEWVVGDES